MAKSSKIFSSFLSREKDGSKAVQALARKVTEDLQGRSCDLAVLFISEGFVNDDPRILAKHFKELVRPGCLVGCNSSGVIGEKREVEMEPAISVLAMHLPGVKLTSFVLSKQDVDLISSGNEMIKNLDIYPTENPKFICLADATECDVTKLLELMNAAYSPAPIIGGLASGLVVGAENWLVLDEEICKGGTVGLALSGDIKFENVVSQGCRPIGEPLIITKAEQNVLYELAGQKPLKVLEKLYGKLSPEDQQLAKHSLFVGLVMNESHLQFKRGDFLIRNILGVDYGKGAVAVGEMLSPGQTLQFQLRDARTAKEDFEILLQDMTTRNPSKASGGILVSCCGRGKELFKGPDHDVQMIEQHYGSVPLCGFFANGEFGRIDRKNYIHGYTSSLTILS